MTFKDILAKLTKFCDNQKHWCILRSTWISLHIIDLTYFILYRKCMHLSVHKMMMVKATLTHMYRLSPRGDPSMPNLPSDLFNTFISTQITAARTLCFKLYVSVMSSYGKLDIRKYIRCCQSFYNVSYIIVSLWKIHLAQFPSFRV